MSEQPPGQGAAEETGAAKEPAPAPLDLGFIRRVYRTTAVVAVLVLIFVWEGLGPMAAWGWACGVVLSLAALAGTEWTVKYAVRRGKASTVLAAMLLKLPILLGVGALLYYAASLGLINLIWVLPGFALPHVVLLLKLLGRRLNELSAAEANPGGGREGN